jgi:hypothetical protein
MAGADLSLEKPHEERVSPGKYDSPCLYSLPDTQYQEPL